MHHEGDDVLVLHANLLGDEIHCCLRSTVRSSRHGGLLHSTNTSKDRGDEYKSTIGSLLEQRICGLEEKDWANSVDLVERLKTAGSSLKCWGWRVTSSGIGDNYINVGDSMAACQSADSLLCTGFRVALDRNKDELASGSSLQILQGQRS